ncbi:MAG: dihydrolipoyllysine-residue acetyltransferase [Proteobacteria bacterium]|nr:dihydrolipoyllysine-residue acetyltransferase [Pseudomonadota bacterium]
MAQIIEVKVPDIGDFKDVPVIEILVKAGDAIQAETPLLTLESDKATIEVPSPAGGVIREVKVKVGDKVSEGTLLLILEAGDAASAAPAAVAPAVSAGPAATPAPVAAVAAPVVEPAPPSAPAPASAPATASGVLAHASPSVRRFARELGVDVVRVTGSGPKGRITAQDVQAYVKGILGGAAAAPAPSTGGGVPQGFPSVVGLDLLPWPKVDFAKFGPVEAKPLSRIKKISGANLWRNWVMIPHVTQFDEADITDLEAFRVAVNKDGDKTGVKLTMLAFLIKASVVALKKFPEFNASLEGDNLILKQYFHIGFAADTPNGLVVPVIRDADRKGVNDIARDMAELSKKARDGKLGPAEMQGGCFSISSLGGIGGTAFTPIINAPEVAILGVSKSEIKPKWDGKQFVPRLQLPLSLSYDHRVIDGATAARFTSFLCQLLGDMRKSML